MDVEVGGTVDKLLSKYREAQAVLDIARPTRLPSKRAQARMQYQAWEAIGRLQSSRKGTSWAVVRLAYVRAVRDFLPDAQLSGDQLTEVEYIAKSLDRDLEQVECQAYFSFRDHLRLLKLGQMAESMRASPQYVDMLVSSNAYYPMMEQAKVAIDRHLAVVQSTANLSSIAVRDKLPYE